MDPNNPIIKQVNLKFDELPKASCKFCGCKVFEVKHMVGELNGLIVGRSGKILVAGALFFCSECKQPNYEFAQANLIEVAPIFPTEPPEEKQPLILHKN